MVEARADTQRAVEIAPRVWWVGAMLPGDRFQCHVYLVEQGDQSVLIDPGSALIVDETIRKVDEIVGVDHVRWLVCSHADPDIIGALPALVAHGLHPEARIVTHWRDEALIVHSGTPLPYWRVEENGWRLPLEDRALSFIFSPYLHFAGAFCTFDDATRTLFSGDLFGGFTVDQELYASSLAYFDAIRAFHEHYMPSREILVHTLEQVRELVPTTIAPQHGQIIRHELITPIIDRLEKLECGIYLLSRDDPGLAFLLAANRTVRDVVDTLVREQSFSAVAAHLDELARRTLRASYLEIWAGSDLFTLEFSAADGFAGHLATAPPDVQRVLHGDTPLPGPRYIWPLTSVETNEVNGAAVLGFDATPTIDPATRTVLAQITGLVEVGMEREVLARTTDAERARWQDRAVHDSLTGVYNRVTLGECFSRVAALDDRHDHPQLAALMVDIDHFKVVNDEFGHQTGDLVLQLVAKCIAASVRPTDFLFRYGGEEFLVLLVDVDEATARVAAERVRSRLLNLADGVPPVTVSVGIAVRRAGEDRESLVERADAALYEAKETGRDRVVVAPA